MAASPFVGRPTALQGEGIWGDKAPQRGEPQPDPPKAGMAQIVALEGVEFDKMLWIMDPEGGVNDFVELYVSETDLHVFFEFQDHMTRRESEDPARHSAWTANMIELLSKHPKGHQVKTIASLVTKARQVRNRAEDVFERDQALISSVKEQRARGQAESKARIDELKQELEQLRPTQDRTKPVGSDDSMMMMMTQLNELQVRTCEAMERQGEMMLLVARETSASREASERRWEESMSPSRAREASPSEAAQIEQTRILQERDKTDSEQKQFLQEYTKHKEPCGITTYCPLELRMVLPRFAVATRESGGKGASANFAVSRTFLMTLDAVAASLVDFLEGREYFTRAGVQTMQSDFKRKAEHVAFPDATMTMGMVSAFNAAGGRVKKGDPGFAAVLEFVLLIQVITQAVESTAMDLPNLLSKTAKDFPGKALVEFKVAMLARIWQVGRLIPRGADHVLELKSREGGHLTGEGGADLPSCQF